MFVRNFLKIIPSKRNGMWFSTSYQKPTGFGDPRLPDKLYKNIELEIKSNERAVLSSYIKFVENAAHHLNLNLGKITSARKPSYERLTLLRSVHGHRKHLVQYEMRTHYSWINLHNLTGSTADTFLEYIQRMLPEGVGLKVTKNSIEPLPKHLTIENVKSFPIEES